jgi:lysophospholipase L1-like esterase
MRQLGRLPYSSKVLATQRSGLIAYWPLDDSGGTVARDVSGHGRHGVYTGVTLGQSVPPFVAPLFDTDYVNVYSASFRDAFTPLKFSLVLALKIGSVGWNNLAVGRPLYFAVNSSNRVVIQKPNTAGGTIDVIYTAGGTGKSVSLAPVIMAGWIVIGLTVDKAADQMKVYRNGVQYGSTVTGLGVWAGTLASTTTVIGASDTASLNPWAGHLAHVAVWADTVLAASEMAAIAAMIQRPGQILFEGDSRTVGLQANATPYPMQAMASIGGNWLAYTVAAGGETAATMITQRAAQIDGLYAASLPRNIVTILAGVNDAAGGASAATIYANLKSWWGGARAAGFRVIAQTEIDAQSAGLNTVSWHSSILPALNALILSDPSLYDAVARNDQDPRLQDATNTTYFNVDALHLATAGNTALAENVLTAWQTL